MFFYDQNTKSLQTKNSQCKTVSAAAEPVGNNMVGCTKKTVQFTDTSGQPRPSTSSGSTVPWLPELVRASVIQLPLPAAAWLTEICDRVSDGRTDS